MPQFEPSHLALASSVSQFMLTVPLALIPAFTGRKSCNGFGGLWTDLIRERVSDVSSAGQAGIDRNTTGGVCFKHGEGKVSLKGRQLMGRIELALGTALEQGTTEVKAVKIDLVGVIAGGYVKHFAIIKINCI